MTAPQQGSISLDSPAGWLWRGVHERRRSVRPRATALVGRRGLVMNV